MFWHYVIVFVASFLVDVIPVFGPPAWSVMVLMQMKFDLNIWWVLSLGVTGSALGRYVYSRFIVPLLAGKFIRKQKNSDMEFIGKKLNQKGWRSALFVFIYTLIPIPTTPIFTATGMAKVNHAYIIPAFFVGKFISDAIMVLTGKYAVKSFSHIMEGMLSWQSITAVVACLVFMSLILFTDWNTLLMKKKFRLNFKIWK
jgi:membrane protein DedA with SNARE-associated domain